MNHYSKLSYAIAAILGSGALGHARPAQAADASSADQIQEIVHQEFRAYRTTLQDDRRRLLERSQDLLRDRFRSRPTRQLPSNNARHISSATKKAQTQDTA